MSTSTKLTLGQRLQRGIAVGLSRLPDPVLTVLARPSLNQDGERMAPEIALLMRVTAAGTDYSDLPVEEARRATEAEGITFADRFGTFAVEQDLELSPGLHATRYRADEPSRGVVLFFHGGGFVLGSRASYEAPAKLLAQGARADVISVEYRLAPEGSFPAAHEDALAAWDYVVAHAQEWGLDPRRIVIAGDSAGANIAAVLCHQVRKRELQPLLQVLIYPVTDVSRNYPSREEFSDSPALTAKQIDWFMGHYLPEGTDLRDPRVSPLLEPDLRGLPPAVVSVAGFDPLRDDGLEYAAALLRNGVRADVLREPGLVHGFISLTAISRTSKVATVRIARSIGEALTRATAGSSDTASRRSSPAS